MPWTTDTGYAIARLERIFFDVALRLAGGDPARVWYAYPDGDAKRPAWSQDEYPRCVGFDIRNSTRTCTQALESFARSHRIDFALTFDVRPIHPAYAALRRGGVKAIVSYWGAPISGPSPFHKWLAKRLQFALSRSTVSGLVFESEAMADLARHGRGIPDRVIDVVPLGVDIRAFEPGRTGYAYSALDIPPERRIVVYSGHCNRRKGVHVMMNAALELLAARRRTDVCFVVCGNKETESEPFEQMVRASEAAPWVRFAGYRNDLYRIFQDAYLGVIPTVEWESYALSSVEMAASGLPVVASRLQGLAESVVDGVTGRLFEPGNAQELADCIEQLLDDQEQTMRLGRAARRRCEMEQTVEQQRDRLYAAFRRHIAEAA
jgi:glycosyltransferase involved in cell wall biosynthesis